MSEKQHVALTRCYFCGESDRILLATTYKKTKEGVEPVRDLAPLHNKIIDMEPCGKCADYMKQGIILLGVDSAKSDPGWAKERIPNPHRTGAFVVLKEEALERLAVFGKNAEGARAFAKKHRFLFIEHEAMEKLGLLPEEEEQKPPTDPS